MAAYDQLDDYRSEYRQQLLRLRLLVGTRDDAALPRDFALEIRDATNAIIAEVEAMSRTALQAGDRRDPQAETFLWARIARLAAAADRAVDAARSRDLPGVLAHLYQFDSLTSALWQVRHATCGDQSDARPAREGA